jgi:formiminotetrahydrofolate cyclodeaminase
VTFADHSLSKFLDALASSNPTPGGGTAAAIGGAMGVSLLVMVTGLAKSRTNSDKEKVELAEARAALGPISIRLVGLADADTDAFNAVMAAYKLPKVTDDEKAARTARIQRALHEATTVPLETLRACADALERAVTVATDGNRAAVSDIGVAVGLLEAAASGADANVQTNLEGLKDAGFRDVTAPEAARLMRDARAHAAAARRQLRKDGES